MSVSSVGSNESQNLGSIILQSLVAAGSGASNPGGAANSLSDLLNLSPSSLSLAKAPAKVTEAMGDLFGAQKDVTGDMATLKGYFKENPGSLATLLGALQGGTSTYGSSGLTSNSALMAALAKAKAGGTDTSSVLSALMGARHESLLDYIGGSSGSTGSNGMSLLG
ncbi:hypothetical protein [Mesoterricola silvestris]|uniref:Uncharacterized protein n=1 Tax=Mesoterricola silvestris TaxID=2927979 RepID=A0AA48K853_9BACT|nr:hypothetical protein [Mesoterricola silvestris]BDU72589.1 hypothetical protein METEAL_17630 [Mesoterricola silvestris]